MKKVLILAVAATLGTSAFAQDVFKQLSKIKDYNEAAALVKSNLGSMSAEQKAKCYNALVDLAYAKVVKEQATITSNQMAEQLKTKVEPYDTVGLYNAVINALESGVACDEFDAQPNEKGKVKPKFHKANAERLYPIRPQLINGVIYYQGKDNSENVIRKFLEAYVESNDYPLFKDVDKSKDANLGQMAYFAGRYAYLAKDYAKAEKYADIAMNDTAFAKDGLTIKLAVMQAQLKSHEDSLTYVSKLKDLYAKDNSNETVFSTLCSMLLNTNDNAGLDALLNEKLAQDPKNFTAWAMRGQSHMNARNWDEAITALQKAEEAQPQNVPVIASIGQCYVFKAQDAYNKAAGKTGRVAPATDQVINGVYQQALGYLEKAKSIDTTREFKSLWAYPLYSCAYKLYGADDPKTQEYEALK